MAEFIANRSNLNIESGKMADELERIISEGGEAKAVITRKSNGTIPMLRLWRMWMRDVAIHMAKRGRTMPMYIDEKGVNRGKRPFNENDAHVAYSHLCLGCDEIGNRLSWCVKSDEYEGRKAASIGQKVKALDKIYQFAMEEGIKLRIPSNTEYQKLKDKQDE